MLQNYPGRNSCCTAATARFLALIRVPPLWRRSHALGSPAAHCACCWVGKRRPYRFFSLPVSLPHTQALLQATVECVVTMSARKRSSRTAAMRGESKRQGRRSSGGRGPRLSAKSARSESKRSQELGVGDKVLVRGIKPGVIRYVGATSFGDGMWVGVQLDKPQGLNDGSVSGTRYFVCDADHVCVCAYDAGIVRHRPRAHHA